MKMANFPINSFAANFYIWGICYELEVSSPSRNRYEYCVDDEQTPCCDVNGMRVTTECTSLSP